MADEEINRAVFPVDILVEVDADDVVRSMTPLQVIEFIIELDKEVGEWEHSLLLYHHFSVQFRAAEQHIPRLAAMNVEELRASLELSESESE